MKPEDVPDEMVEHAAHMYIEAPGGPGFRDRLRVVLAAAWPAIEATIRAKVAADLEAAVDQYPTTIWPEPTGEDDLPDRFSASAARTAYRNAARIARGETDA